MKRWIQLTLAAPLVAGLALAQTEAQYPSRSTDRKDTTATSESQTPSAQKSEKKTQKDVSARTRHWKGMLVDANCGSPSASRTSVNQGTAALEQTPSTSNNPSTEATADRSTASSADRSTASSADRSTASSAERGAATPAERGAMPPSERSAIPPAERSGTNAAERGSVTPESPNAAESAAERTNRGTRMPENPASPEAGKPPEATTAPEAASADRSMTQPSTAGQPGATGSAQWQSCPATSSTTAFGMVLPDGKFVRFDAVGNVRAAEAFKKNKKWTEKASSGKPPEAKVEGMLEGETLVVSSIK